MGRGKERERIREKISERNTYIESERVGGRNSDEKERIKCG